MLSVFEIGEKIAIARKVKNLTQGQLAELLAVSAQAVGKWERGESMPDIITFGRMAENLGVDLNYFSDGHSVPEALVGAARSIEGASEATQKFGWNMSGSNWVDADLSGLHGLTEKFNGANIDKCQFIGSELSGLVLKGNNIKRSNFSHSDLSNCKFSGTNFTDNICCDCNFNKSEFSRSNIANCDFSNADLTGFTAKWSNFKNIKLSGATLLRTTFKLGQLTEVTFDGKITSCAFENCDFAHVKFHGAVIRDTFFKNCKLKRAAFNACKADRLSYAFMKACKADLADVEIIEE